MPLQFTYLTSMHCILTSILFENWQIPPTKSGNPENRKIGYGEIPIFPGALGRGRLLWAPEFRAPFLAATQSEKADGHDEKRGAGKLLAPSLCKQPPGPRSLNLRIARIFQQGRKFSSLPEIGRSVAGSTPGT